MMMMMMMMMLMMSSSGSHTKIFPFAIVLPFQQRKYFILNLWPSSSSVTAASTYSYFSFLTSQEKTTITNRRTESTATYIRSLTIWQLEPTSFFVGGAIVLSFPNRSRWNWDATEQEGYTKVVFKDLFCPLQIENVWKSAHSPYSSTSSISSSGSHTKMLMRYYTHYKLFRESKGVQNDC